VYHAPRLFFINDFLGIRKTLEENHGARRDRKIHFEENAGSTGRLKTRMMFDTHFENARRLARGIGSLLYAAVCLLALGTPAHAGIMAYDLVPDHTQDRSDGPWSLGWAFAVNTPIWVTALDFWDNPNAPLSLSHDVAIWDSTQTEVAFATILVTDPLSPGAETNWLQHAITPVYLATGNYIIAGETSNESFTQFPLSTSVAPEISYLRDAYFFPQGPSLTYPNATSNISGSYFGPSFELTDAAVPEPSTFGLILAGLAAAGLRRRRSARTPSSPIPLP